MKTPTYSRCFPVNIAKLLGTSTIFTRVSARGAHLIFGFQRGVLIQGRRSFEGGTHLKSQVHNNITSTFLFKNNKTNNKRDKLVGHIPIEISRLSYHFLNESSENRIQGVVIGKRTREVGLVVPVEYTAATIDKVTAKIFLSELKKRKEKHLHFNLEIVNLEKNNCKTLMLTKKNS